jgi:hypothetical protein
VLPLFDQWKRELFGTYTASADIMEPCRPILGTDLGDPGDAKHER